jgi:hypothetical protein
LDIQVQWLVKKGADVNTTNSLGLTPKAASEANPYAKEIFQWLDEWMKH